MDPDTNILEQLKLAQEIAVAYEEEGDHHNAARLAELVLALDAWLSRKGFLPMRWRLAAQQPERGSR